MHYSFKSTPTWSMPGRPKSAFASSPGPADYNVNKPLHQSGTVSAVTQQRNLFKKFQDFPGPGNYHTKSYINDGPKRTMSARSTEYIKRTPGPHEYDNNTLKVKNKAPKFTMSTMSKSYHQLTFQKNTYKPSPTTYNKNGTFENKTGIFIGTSSRKDLTETEKTPAPNYYASKQAKDYTSTINPKCIMGSQTRKTTEFMKRETTPSPSKYQLKSQFLKNKQKKKGYSCRNKTVDLIAQQISKFPGPGQYNSSLVNKTTAPRCSSTKTLRKTFMDDMQDFKKPYPGPGHHNDHGFIQSKNRSTSSYLFSKTNRRPLDQGEKTPGPVEYRNNKLNIMNSQPKFSPTKTVGKNQFLGVIQGIPGSGDYNPSLLLVKQSTSRHQIGREQRPNFDHHKFLPGPGYYNLLGKKNGGWTFKKELRIAFTDKKSQAKYGNQYNIPNKVVDPPGYMNVQSKVKYDSPLKNTFSTLTTARKSPQKNH